MEPSWQQTEGRGREEQGCRVKMAVEKVKTRGGWKETRRERQDTDYEIIKRTGRLVGRDDGLLGGKERGRDQ